MKRIVSATLLLTMFSAVYAQYQHVPASLARRDFNIASPIDAPAGNVLRGGQRGIHQFVLDYASADLLYADLIGTFGYFLFWEIHKNYKAGPPNDTSGNNTCKWALVQFDTLYDAVAETGYPLAGTFVKVDTIALEMNHINTSGQNDTLTISILEKENTPSGLLSANNGLTLDNTVWWDTVIVTNTSLTPGTPSNQRAQVLIPCGFDTTGLPFIIKVDYTGPLEDTLRLADFNRDDCLTPQGPPPGESVSASESIFPDNSWRYLNLYIPANPPTVPVARNFNGVGTLVLGGTTPEECNRYYFQNWGISALVTINVPLGATTSQSKTDVCPGETVQLDIAIYGGTLPYQAVSWDPITGLNPPFGSSNPTATVNETTTYTATIIDADSTVITRQFTINVRGITVDAGPDVDMACGASTTLVATPGGTFTPSNYLWSNGPVTLNNTVTAAGTYSVTASNSYGCMATDNVVVTLQGVNQTLGFEIGNAPSNVSCIGQAVTFTNTSSSLGTEWKWLWTFGEGSTNSSMNTSWTYNAVGNYTVSLSGYFLSGSDTCAVTPIYQNLTIQTECPTGISDPELESRIELFPNPNNGVFTLNFMDADSRNAVVGVYDIRGMKVSEERITLNGQPQTQIDMSRAAEGVYFVKIQTEKGIAVKRFTLSK